MLPVVPRSVNSVACVKRIQHEIYVSWQAQSFVRLEDDTIVAPRIINDVSYVLRINDEMHFACQAQYLVKLEDDFGCSAQCK